MKVILFLTALIQCELPTFAASFVHCTKMLIISTGYHAAFCVAQRPEGRLPLPNSHSQLG